MTVKVGDRFKWNRKGSVLRVTDVRDQKIKFEVSGNISLSGSMTFQEFRNQFLVKGRMAA